MAHDKTHLRRKIGADVSEKPESTSSHHNPTEEALPKVPARS